MIKFHAHGNVSQLMTLFSVLSQSTDVLEVRSGQLYRRKDPNKAHQYFEVTLTGSDSYVLIPRQRSRHGYVYLAQAPDGSCKIGRSKNIRNRRQTFGVKLPFKVVFVHVIETDDMYRLEKSLHARFANQRLRSSEFFALTEADVTYIQSL